MTRPRLLSIKLAGLLAILVAAVAAAPASAATPSIAPGYYHLCAVEYSGTVKCRGYNDFGEVSQQAVEQYGAVHTIDLGGAKAEAVAAGTYMTCALLEGGAVKCWGSNSDYALGDGTGPDSPTPVTVDLGGHPATQIGLGDYFGCALVDDGDVMCWGTNGSGQTGTGTSGSPVQVPAKVDLGSRKAAKLSVGWDTVCVLATDGTAWCWGENDYNEVSPSSDGVIDEPNQIDLGGEPVAAIETEYQHSCALLVSGTVKCWGYNGDGALGDGSFDHSDTPVTAQFAEPAKSIALGWYNSCAQLVSGKVQCAGDNSLGSLGLGTDQGDTNVPLDYPVTEPIRSLFVGNGAVCVITEPGSAKCSGYYVKSAIDGDSSDTDAFTPMLIPGWDLSIPEPPQPAPPAPAAVTGKIAKPKLKSKIKRGKINVTGNVTVGGSGVTAAQCTGKLRVAVTLKVKRKTKKLATKSFALKFSGGKCVAKVALKFKKTYRKKKPTFKFSVTGAPLLTVKAVSIKKQL